LLLPRIEQSLYITAGQEMPPKLPLPVGAFIEHIVPWTYPSVYHKQHIHFPRAHSHNLQTHTHTHNIHTGLAGDHIFKTGQGIEMQNAAEGKQEWGGMSPSPID